MIQCDGSCSVSTPGNHNQTRGNCGTINCAGQCGANQGTCLPGSAQCANCSYQTCASGSPQPKVEIHAEVSCASGTLVKTTRIVVYNGKPVKMVVAMCG